jgi:hypothetical protein
LENPYSLFYPITCPDHEPFCISSDPPGYGGEFDENLPAPIWSPDGKQIIVENRFSDEHNRVVLVDLSNMIAVEIAKDARPVGWMVD